MRGPDGKPIAISIEPMEEAEFHTGGAGLFSRPLVFFTRMLLAGGALDGVEVLKPETVKLMARRMPSATLTSRWCAAITLRWRLKSRHSLGKSRNGG